MAAAQRRSERSWAGVRGVGRNRHPKTRQGRGECLAESITRRTLGLKGKTCGSAAVRVGRGIAGGNGPFATEGPGLRLRIRSRCRTPDPTANRPRSGPLVRDQPSGPPRSRGAPRDARSITFRHPAARATLSAPHPPDGPAHLRSSHALSAPSQPHQEDPQRGIPRPHEHDQGSEDPQQQAAPRSADLRPLGRCAAAAPPARLGAKGTTDAPDASGGPNLFSSSAAHPAGPRIESSPRVRTTARGFSFLHPRG